MLSNRPTTESSPKPSSSSSKMESACGPCRAMGIDPPCKGHGQQGGSGSGNSSEKFDKKNNEPSIDDFKKILAQLNQNGIWKQDAKQEGVYKFEDENALVDIEFDADSGKLSFSTKPGLNEEEQKAASELWKAIEKNFDDFKSELSKQGIPVERFTNEPRGNMHILTLPSKKYFDMFIQRLINTNLLPTLKPQPQNKKDNAEEEAKQHKSSPRTPFPTKPAGLDTELKRS